METKEIIIKLVEALNHQHLSVNEKLFKEAFANDLDFLTGGKKKVVDALSPIIKSIVSYENINDKDFNNDLNRFQNTVDPKMLISWGYNSGTLMIVGIKYADYLSDSDIQTLFSKFDDGVTNIMRKHVGRLYADSKGGIYGTMVLVYSDPSRCENFNKNIKQYFSSHFWKQSYVSCFSVDCTSETITQGKGMLGRSWTGGLEMKVLRKDVFG